jgi:hypothetical protein
VWGRPGRVPPGFRPLRGLHPAVRCVLRSLAKASRLRLRAHGTPETPPQARGVHANRWIQAQLRMLTARAVTSTTSTNDESDWADISSLAMPLTGSVSVGLNAVAFVLEK